MEERIKNLETMGFEVVHLGINSLDNEDALSVVKFFASLFGFQISDNKDSVFAGQAIEIMKGNGRGTNGHIAIAVNDIYKGKTYLENIGCVFDYDSAKYNSNGNLILMYLKDEIAGFAVHLLQK